MNSLNKFQSGEHFFLLPDQALEFLGSVENTHGVDCVRFNGAKDRIWNTKTTDYFRLDINSLRPNPIEFTDTIKIVPWQGEHYATIVLMKLKLYCEKHKIKVIASGTMNYIPALGFIADELYLESDPDLSKLYKYKICHAHRCALEDNGYCPRCRKICEEVETDSSGQIIRDNPYFDVLPFKRPSVRPDYTDHRLPVDPKIDPLGYELEHLAEKEISDEEVIERYSFPPTYILKSVWDFYWRIKNLFGEDLIWSETRVKLTDQTVEGLGIPIIGGRGNNSQSALIGAVGNNNYMSFQLLGSIFSNWFFICREGSANILSFIPVKALMLVEHRLFKYVNIIRGFARNRYGELGDKMPIIVPKLIPHQDFCHFVSMNAKSINSFVAACENIPPAPSIGEKYIRAQRALGLS